MSNIEKTINMTEGPITKPLIMFVIPLMLSNLFQQLYTTVDAAIIGRYVGSVGLAAVSSCGILGVFMIYLFLGLSHGASIVVSHAYGDKNEEKIKITVHTTAALSIISGIVLMAFGILASPLFLKMMNVPDEVFPSAVLYLRIYFAGMIPMMIYNMGSGILRASGDSKSPLFYLIFSGIANLLMNILFVVFFKMGVAGAALATTLAQTLSAILVILHFFKTSEVYRLSISNIRLNPKMCRKIFKIGIPSGIQSVLVCFSNVIVQSKVNLFDLNAMAGFGAYLKLDGFLYMPIAAFGMGISTFTAQNYGAGKIDRIKKGKKIIMLTCVGLNIIMVIVFIFNGQYLLSLFTDSAADISYGLRAMHIIMPLYFIYASNQIYYGVISGTGRTNVPMMITLICMCGLRILWVCVGLIFIDDIRIIYIGYPLTWIVTHIVTSIYYYKGNFLKDAMVNI